MNEDSLLEIINGIPDPRAQDDRLKHKLSDILAIVICSVLSGCEDFQEIHDYGLERFDWFSRFLELKNGMPSADTIARVMSLVEYSEVEKAMRQWVAEWQQAHPHSGKREVVAIDGKFVNGSRQQPYNSRSALLMVSAYATQAGICLGEERSHLKKEEGEKRATEKLIESLHLKGTIVTLDAGGATTRIVEGICKKKADWLIGLKENQKSLFKLAEQAFEVQPKEKNEYRTEETAHGRHEVREYKQILMKDCDASGMHQNFLLQQEKWPTLESFIRVHAERTIIENGKVKTATSTRYYFSSLKEDVAEAAYAIRSHWSVENNVHWTLDVAFREDSWRARMKQAGENLASIRRLAFNMLKKETTHKASIKRKIKKCGWDSGYLERVLTAQGAPH